MAATPETSIIFRRTGGHTHDGLTSSLLDTTKYSIFDFAPVSNGSAGTARRRFQDNNKVLIKKFIIDTVEERVLNPQGIEIKANTITARHISAGTITSDQLTSNLVLVNNIIRSNSFNGAFYSNGAISNFGTVGWAIANSGAAVFNDVTIRGNFYQGTGNWANADTKIFANTGGYFSLGPNFKWDGSTLTIVGNVNLSSTNIGTFDNGDSIDAGSVGGWTITSNSIYSGNTYLYSNGYINAATGKFSGEIQANSGNIGGWSIGSTTLSAGSTTLYSNGYISAAAGSFTGTINASGGTFSGVIQSGNDSIRYVQVGNGLRSVANYAGIVLRDDSWENGFLRRSDGSVYFRAGGASDRYIYLDTAAGISGSTNMINFPSFQVTYDGAITASSGTIGGFSLSSSVFSASSGSPVFGQYTYININSNGLIESFYQDIGFVSNFYEHVKINNYASGGSGAINITGTAAGFGSTRWYTSYGVYNPSDIRLKNIVEENVDALSMIKNVQTTKFIMKNDESQREQFGFIAQQINEYIPNVAIPGGENPETNPWGIVQEGLIPYLVKSIQQLAEKVESLESKGV